MGFMDDLKKAASSVASDAGKASKVAQAQLKLKSLQSDVSDAEKELGIAAWGLIERGELSHPELEASIAKLKDALAAVKAKEEEIAAIKAEGEIPPATPSA